MSKRRDWFWVIRSPDGSDVYMFPLARPKPIVKMAESAYDSPSYQYVDDEQQQKGNRIQDQAAIICYPAWLKLTAVVLEPGIATKVQFNCVKMVK